MWRKITLILFLLPLFSMAQFTDCKEYGFKGDISKVTTYSYFGLEKEDDQWIVDQTKLASIMTFYVDENCNFEKIEISAFDDGHFDTYTYRYYFEDGLKTSYTISNNDNEMIGSGTIEWISEKVYKSTISFDDYISVDLSILNDNFQDYIFQQYYYIIEDGQTNLYSTKFSTTFRNPDGVPIKTEFIEDFEEDEKYFIHNEIVKVDEKGNMLEFALMKDSGELDRYMKRVIEYRD